MENNNINSMSMNGYPYDAPPTVGQPGSLDLPKSKLFINTQVPSISNTVSTSIQSGSSTAGITPYSDINMHSALISPGGSGKRRRSVSPVFAKGPQGLCLFRGAGDEQLVTELHSRAEGGFFYYENICTCYRRNYFRVLSSFTLNGAESGVEVRGRLDEQQIMVQSQQDGSYKRVARFETMLSALSNSASQKKVDLIAHSGKRSKNCTGSPQSRPIVPGGIRCEPAPPKTPVGVDHPTAFSLATSPFMDYVVAFDRIQFRNATANNGKRKCLQQFFKLVVSLIAVMEDGTAQIVCENISEDMVVRGRSPSHYADVSRMKVRKSNEMAIMMASDEQSSVHGMNTPQAQRRASWSNVIMPLGSRQHQHSMQYGPQSAYPTLFDQTHISQDTFVVRNQSTIDLPLENTTEHQSFTFQHQSIPVSPMFREGYNPMATPAGLSEHPSDEETGWAPPLSQGTSHGGTDAPPSSAISISDEDELIKMLSINGGNEGKIWQF